MFFLIILNSLFTDSLHFPSAFIHGLIQLFFNVMNRIKIINQVWLGLILLHTAKAEIFKCDENRKASSRILFDLCSQHNYCTDNLRKTLKLKSVRKETILMKRFASDEGVLKVLDVLQICVTGKTKTVNVCIEALRVPLLCSPLQDQTLNGVFTENYNYLKDQVYSNTRVSTQVNTSQHKSTRITTSLTQVNTRLTRVNMSPTRVNTNQHEPGTSQYKWTRV